MSPKATKILAGLVKDKPISIETKLEKLEHDMQRRLDSLEESIDLVKDVALKLHKEREKFRKENIWLKHKLGKITQPIVEESREIVNLMADGLHGSENEDPGETIEESTSNEPAIRHLPVKINIGKGAEATKSSVVWSKKKDPRQKTIKWMRAKFGLAPTPAKKITMQQSDKVILEADIPKGQQNISMKQR
jgi:Mg2+ and Co2+ transporter CorA